MLLQASLLCSLHAKGGTLFPHLQSPMSGSDASEEASGETCMNEAVIENLRRCRADMLDNLKKSLDSAMEFELRDYQRYSHFETVQIATSFMEDSEDIGPEEDLALLGIK